MKIAMIGLGKMGSNMTRRLLRAGHEVVVWDRSPEAIATLQAEGAQGAESLENLVQALSGPRYLWLMIPAGEAVEETLKTLKPLLQRGDVIIDGGNSHWKDTVRRADSLVESGIHWVDCGTSGGVWGLQEGYCLMYGGQAEACQNLEPIFSSLAPENGHLYCGEAGAGHFTKMVHNGIEYGIMQAYAEGFELLNTTPFAIDLPAVAKVWQHGSVIRSWLLELTEKALADDPGLSTLEAYVPDSGEGRWTVEAALDLAVPTPVITQALFARFQSRNPEAFSFKLLSALRHQFGGHAMKKTNNDSQPKRD